MIAFVVALTSVVFAAIASATAPSNDNFASAQTIPNTGGTIDGTNVDATAEPGEPTPSPYGANHTIWYRYTAPAAGPVAISTCDSAFNTIVAAYTGSSLASLTEVAHNDDAGSAGPCPNTKFSYLTFDATAGTTYSIQIDTVGDLNGDGSGPPRGPVHLTLSGPQPPTPPPPADTGTTSPGTVIPIYATGARGVMPDLLPRKSGNGWKFSTLKDAEKAFTKLEAAGMNLRFRWQKKALRAFPKDERDYLQAHPGDGGQIVKTRPKPGTELVTTAADYAEITIAYWDPTSDKRYQRELKKEIERRRAEEEAERNRCKLLSVDIQDVNRLVLADTFDSAKKTLAAYHCSAHIDHVEWNNRIFREYVTDVKADKQSNGFGLVVTEPKDPDFTITWREDPATIADKNQLSLVSQPDGDWVLPRSSQSTSRMTVQVNERTTGRFVQGATIEITDVGDTGKRLVSTKTNANGEATFTFHLPKETTLLVTATVDDGSNVMSAERDLQVREEGHSLTTICGRTLTLQHVNGKVMYQGSQADLDRCRGLGVVPANLGDGRGVSTPRVPAVEQTPALTVGNVNGTPQLIAGTYNAISIAGSNTIVGAAPGVIAAGGGNVIAAGGGNKAARKLGLPPSERFGFFGAVGDLLNNIATNVTRAFNQGVSIVRSMLSGAAPAVQQTANQLTQQGAAVPPATTLKPEGIGVIAAGGGNVIAAGGGNVIAAGGGNLISDKGLGLISDKGLGVIAAGGGNVIAAGGGNLMPVYGGRFISQDGAS
jgi:hypothetical protein